MAQAVLHIWAENQGKKPPTALDIALYFESAEAWTLTLEEQWSRIGLGLPLSHRLTQASASFFEACATRGRLWGPSIAKRNASSALQPVEALKQARLTHLALCTQAISYKDPIEVRTRRYGRLLQTATPSKMKPELPGFPEHEAFMLQVAVEAKGFSRHHKLFLHEAGEGFSVHFHTTWRNMIGSLQPTALAHCVS